MPVYILCARMICATFWQLILMMTAGVNLVCKPNIHQKFSIIDQKIVWYGSINLLSFGHAEESIMRLNSSSIASELIRIINHSILVRN